MSFVDPASLSLPSSSLKRPASPAYSTDDSPSLATSEPPRKRPRSAVTPEERKEARAHRNRIAAQNSRDRRKAQFGYLERRVAELEEENRRLRAGIHVSPSPSISTLSEPDPIESGQEQQRKRQEEQRERENQELRERIRTLEQGYEAVLRALATQGNPSVTSTVSTPAASSAPDVSSQSQPISNTTSSPDITMTSLSSAPSLPLSPTSSNSTLVDSPLLFSSGDSIEFPQSLALDTRLALPEKALDLSLANSTLTRHLARVANTANHLAVPLQRPSKMLGNNAPEYEDEAASDATIARLFAEILASPPLGSSTLPSSSTSSEDAFGKEVLTKADTNPLGFGLGIGTSGTVDWTERVHVEMEMGKLLEMLPNAQHVTADAILHHDDDIHADMDFSSALTWDEVSVS